MRVKDLTGRLYIWNISGHTITNANDREVRSELHLKARQLLKETFPTHTICEEVPIDINRYSKVFLDFYLPLKKLAIEVQGEQHFKYTPFFHYNVQSFIKQQQRDNKKKAWCSINNITLIEFPYNQTIEQWKSKLI
jgi:very-short-patch-repair endonuclease